MSDAAVKESRRVLRLVQGHLTQAHVKLGVQQQSMGLVDVIHHPVSKLPHLNYVSPRQKTAWIPEPEVEKGLVQLNQLGRTPRVIYIEGLYPPLFARSLRQLGLKVEREVPIMVCKPEDLQGEQTLDEGFRVEMPNDAEGIALWWYVWRNARYDVYTGTIQPVYIGQDMREVAMGYQLDVLLYRYNFPVGVARLIFHNEVANINGIALMKEVRTEATMQLIYQIAAQAAFKRGCEVVFTSGETDAERRACRKSGFVDVGSLVSYVQQDTHEEINALAEPIFMPQ